MNIKNIIKTCCTRRNITNAELAKKVNESPANLSNKLRRKSVMVDDFEKYINALDAHIDLDIVDNKTDDLMYHYSGKEGNE